MVSFNSFILRASFSSGLVEACFFTEISLNLSPISPESSLYFALSFFARAFSISLE